MRQHVTYCCFVWIKEDGELLVWKPAPAKAILQPEAKFCLKLSHCMYFVKWVFLFNLFFFSLYIGLFFLFHFFVLQ